MADDIRSKFGPSQVGRRGAPPNPSHNLHYQHHPYSQPPPLYENLVELQQYPRLLGDTSHHLPVHVRTFYQPKASTSPASSIPSYRHFSSGIYAARSVDETLDSVATGYDDDDTTTSGSYTIDADEYPIEVRIQKVPDVFVWWCYYIISCVPQILVKKSFLRTKTSQSKTECYTIQKLVNQDLFLLCNILLGTCVIDLHNVQCSWCIITQIFFFRDAFMGSRTIQFGYNIYIHVYHKQNDLFGQKSSHEKY